MAWFCESAGEFAVFFAVIPFFSYLFGSCCLFICIADDIREDLTVFNILTAHTAKKSDVENRVELMNRYRSNVQVYLDAKQ